ncbi:MAG: 4'-phosphopantetheinyl transferase superfamily protein, partial [Deltaproteobacteria bacterium]|nr:4'-phosphopantetheinyl transferase superfamily protein [Deltaproteobacteria bacterium]
MIIGIGTDIVSIQRIEKAVERFGERFINKVFTDEEAIVCKG